MISNGTLESFECLSLFTASAEDERIAAFESHDALSCSAKLHQEVVDFFLRHGAPIAARVFPTKKSSGAPVSLAPGGSKSGLTRAS
jgi:hypothetical protein